MLRVFTGEIVKNYHVNKNRNYTDTHLKHSFIVEILNGIVMTISIKF